MTARQRSLLIEEPPLQIIPGLAKEIGLNEAILLQQIHYWLGRSENERDGRKFVYKTTQEWAEEFPFWSEPTIKRTISNLKARGLIIITKKSAGSWERVNWYTVDYEALASIGSKCADALDQNDPMHGVNSTPSTGSKRPDRTDQIDPITLTTETTSKTTSKSPAHRPGEDYVPSPSVLAWVKENGFGPYLKLHIEQFRDTCTTQQRKPYAERGLDAAFRKCVREDWGGVRKQAQMAARRGEAPVSGSWWKSTEGVLEQGAKLGIVPPAEKTAGWIVPYKARVFVAAGEGPWIDERDTTVFRMVQQLRAEKLAA